jgi:fluoride exporter
MMEWLAVFLGGGLGSLSRLGISKWLGGAEGVFPWATFLTNILACLVLGVVAGYVSHKGQLPHALRMGITAGFCGGFSTFSTFSLESVKLWEGGKFMLMGVYVVASVVVCFFGIWLGQWMGSSE